MSSTLLINPFISGQSIWDRWLQREGALAIMKITDDKDKAKYLLQYVGDDAYNAL